MTIANGNFAEIDRPCSPDIMLGAYLMSHLRHYCENCGTFETPQWRKGWFSDVLNRSVLLCNACGLKYHKNQYCPYCRYVYGKEQDKTSNVWQTCQSCGRWVHNECEKKFSNVDVSGATNYHCPNCRKENKENFNNVTNFSFPLPLKHVENHEIFPITEPKPMKVYSPSLHRSTSALAETMETD